MNWNDLIIRPQGARAKAQSSPPARFTSHSSEGSHNNKNQNKKTAYTDFFTKPIKRQTTLENNLQPLPALAKEFSGFPEELERAALAELEKQFFQLQSLLQQAASEKFEEVENQLNDAVENIERKERQIQEFSKLVLTALREEFKDEELSRIFGVLNPELLVLQLGRNGVTVTTSGRKAILDQLREILARTKGNIYQDESITVCFRPATVTNVDKLRRELQQLQNDRQRLEKLVGALQQRQKYERELASLTELKTRQAAKIQRFDAFQSARAQEQEWRK